MSMCGKYLRISFERLKQLQSQPEALKEFLSCVLPPFREQFFDLNRFWSDLHDYLERLPLPSSIWTYLDNGYTDVCVALCLKSCTLAIVLHNFRQYPHLSTSQNAIGYPYPHHKTRQERPCDRKNQPLQPLVAI